MIVRYKSRKIEKVCTDATIAEKQYGFEMAVKIQTRIGELIAADNVDMLVRFGVGRCHPLKGQRKKQYAMDLIHPYRLIFTSTKDLPDAHEALVIEIVDYH